jgi:hypothetical protein
MKLLKDGYHVSVWLVKKHFKIVCAKLIIKSIDFVNTLVCDLSSLGKKLNSTCPTYITIEDYIIILVCICSNVSIMYKLPCQILYLKYTILKI